MNSETELEICFRVYWSWMRVFIWWCRPYICEW